MSSCWSLYMYMEHADEGKTVVDSQVLLSTSTDQKHYYILMRNSVSLGCRCPTSDHPNRSAFSSSLQPSSLPAPQLTNMHPCPLYTCTPKHSLTSHGAAEGHAFLQLVGGGVCILVHNELACVRRNDLDNPQIEIMWTEVSASSH